MNVVKVQNFRPHGETSGSPDWSYAPPALGLINTTTAVTIKDAVAGQRNYITGIQVTTNLALGTATVLAVRDGAGGTVLWRLSLPTTINPAGWRFTFPTPLRSSVNTLLEIVTLTANGTGTIYFNAQGYVAP